MRHARGAVLSAELHDYVSAGYDVGSGGGRLLAGQAATYGFEFEASILSGFHGAAHGLADERWYLQAALLNVEHHRASSRGMGRRRVANGNRFFGVGLRLGCLRCWQRLVLADRRLDDFSVAVGSRRRGGARHN